MISLEIVYLNVYLPKLKTLGFYFFDGSKLKTLDLPSLEIIDGRSLGKNQFQKVNLPKLQKMENMN